MIVSSFNDDFLDTVGSLTDTSGDETHVGLDRGTSEVTIHVTVEDRTLADVTDIPWARAVYTVNQARQLRDILQDAIRQAERAKVR